MAKTFQVGMIDPAKFYKLLNAALAYQEYVSDPDVNKLAEGLGEMFDPDEGPIIVTQGEPELVADGGSGRRLRAGVLPSLAGVPGRVRGSNAPVRGSRIADAYRKATGATDVR